MRINTLRFLCFILTIVITAVTSFAEQAPGFRAHDLAGKLVLSDDYHSRFVPAEDKKVLVLLFYNKECKACIEEIDEVLQIYEQTKSLSVEFLYVYSDLGSESDLKKAAEHFNKKFGIKFRTLLDARISMYESYSKFAGVDVNKDGIRLPMTQIVDRNGKIVYSHLKSINEATVPKLVQKIVQVAQ